jgi:hypothetical protein
MTMAFISQGFHVTFDENGNPITLKLEGVGNDPTGQSTEEECFYTLVTADITGINAVITNAKASCGGMG